MLGYNNTRSKTVEKEPEAMSSRWQIPDNIKNKGNVNTFKHKLNQLMSFFDRNPLVAQIGAYADLLLFGNFDYEFTWLGDNKLLVY